MFLVCGKSLKLTSIFFIKIIINLRVGGLGLRHVFVTNIQRKILIYPYSFVGGM